MKDTGINSELIYLIERGQKLHSYPYLSEDLLLSHDYDSWASEINKFFDKHKISHLKSFLYTPSLQKSYQSKPAVLGGVLQVHIDRKERTPARVHDFITEKLSYLEKLQAELLSSSHYLLDKDADGNFIYQGKRIKMGHDTIYYKLLDFIFTQWKINPNKMISDKEIRKHLEKSGYAASVKDPYMIIRARNAVGTQDQGLFKNARIPYDTPTGRPLIERTRESGYLLNNS